MHTLRTLIDAILFASQQNKNEFISQFIAFLTQRDVYDIYSFVKQIYSLEEQSTIRKTGDINVN